MNGVAATELRDLKPWEPYRRPDKAWDTGATALFAALVVAGAAVALWRRLRRAPSPERAADRALAALGAAQHLPDAAFYRELTSALRGLFGSRVGLSSRALTETELAQRLAALPLPDEVTSGLSDLLQCAEAAAYGRQPVGPARRAAHLSLARRLVRLSPPGRRPVAPA